MVIVIYQNIETCLIPYQYHVTQEGEQSIHLVVNTQNFTKQERIYVLCVRINYFLQKSNVVLDVAG
jgi:hypothetical protein